MIGSRATINRLATGVPGLDEVLGGGLPEFSFNLIAAPSGCGKTTLAHQMMFALPFARAPGALLHGARRATAENAALPATIRFLRSGQAQPLDPVHQSFERHHVRSGQSTQAYLRRSRGAQRGPDFRRFFSFPGFGKHSEQKTSVGLQQFTQNLGVLMTSWQATTFLIGEYSTEHDPDPILTVAVWTDLVAPEHPGQFRCAKNGNHEDARASHPARAAHVSHQQCRYQSVCTPAVCIIEYRIGTARTDAAVDGHTRPGRNDGWRFAARLFLACCRSVRLGQEHHGFSLPH